MSIRITKVEYGNPYHTDKTNWFLANPTDKQTAYIDFDYSCALVGNPQNKFMMARVNALTTQSGVYWDSLGFEKGDVTTLDFTINDNGNIKSYTQSLTIDYLDGDIIVFTTNIADMPFSVFPAEQGNKSIYDVELYVDKIPQGIDVDYRLIENEVISKSLIDDTISLLSSKDINTLALSTPKSMDMVGLQSGSSILNSSIEYVSKSGHTYTYQVVIDFIVSTLFQNKDNIQDRVAPSYYLDDKSITDYMVITAYPVYNNPNVRVVSDYKISIGNGGWFGENFNRRTIDEVVYDVELTDLEGNPLDGVSHSSPTKVKYKVSGIDNLVVNQTKVSIGFVNINNNYSENNNGFHKNSFMNNQELLVDNTVNTTVYAGYGINGGRIDITSVFLNINSSVLEVSYILEPNSEFSNIVSGYSTNRYALFSSVGDYTLATNLTDRTTLIVSANEMVERSSTDGRNDGVTNTFYEHPEDIDINNPLASSIKYDGFIKDDVVCEAVIVSEKTDPLSSVKMAIEVENFDGDIYTLQSFEIDTRNNERVFFEKVVGFKESITDLRNLVKLEPYSQADPNKYAHKLTYGFKIRWEDWIRRADVPAIFKDILRVNDGLNDDWRSYINNNGYTFKYAIYTQTDSGYYRNAYDFKFDDYDSNGDITTTISYFDDATNDVLNSGTIGTVPLGVMVDDKLKRIEFEFDSTNGWTVDSYATICLEPTNGGQKGLYQLGSERVSSVADNPLKPLSGDTKLVLSYAGSKMTVKCLLDPTLIDANYVLSARVGKMKPTGVDVNLTATDNGIGDPTWTLKLLKDSANVNSGDYIPVEVFVDSLKIASATLIVGQDPTTGLGVLGGTDINWLTGVNPIADYFTPNTIDAASVNVGGENLIFNKALWAKDTLNLGVNKGKSIEWRANNVTYMTARNSSFMIEARGYTSSDIQANYLFANSFLNLVDCTNGFINNWARSYVDIGITPSFDQTAKTLGIIGTNLYRISPNPSTATDGKETLSKWTLQDNFAVYPEYITPKELTHGIRYENGTQNAGIWVEVSETFPSVHKYNFRLYTSNYDGGVPQTWVWGIYKGKNPNDDSDNPLTRDTAYSSTSAINGYGSWFEIEFDGQGVWNLTAFQQTPNPDAPNLNFKSGNIPIIHSNIIFIIFSY